MNKREGIGMLAALTTELQLLMLMFGAGIVLALCIRAIINKSNQA